MPLSNNPYNLNFKKLLIWLLPTPLRRPWWIAWLLALISPLIKLYQEFLAFRTAVLYRLSIKPQVCFIEKALNDRFDVASRGIWIDDSIEFNPLPLFLKAENKPVVLYKKSEGIPLILYTKGETATYTVDFIINVPASVVFDANEMRSYVKSFLDCVKFKIVIV